MPEDIRVGDHVKVFLGPKSANMEGWFNGRVFKIDAYSGHRGFYWVELDADAQAILGIKLISVFNPKNIQRLDDCSISKKD